MNVFDLMRRSHLLLLVWISIGMAVLAMLASAVGVFGYAYSADAPNLAAQAMGQDGVNLFLSYPFMIFLCIRIIKGSLQAYLAWIDMLI